MVVGFRGTEDAVSLSRFVVVIGVVIFVFGAGVWAEAAFCGIAGEQ
jgi:hypothetical protein